LIILYYILRMSSHIEYKVNRKEPINLSNIIRRKKIFPKITPDKTPITPKIHTKRTKRRKQARSEKFNKNINSNDIK